MNMTNIAYTDKYQQWRVEQSRIFESKPVEESSFSLPPDREYTFQCFSYAQLQEHPDGGNMHFTAEKVYIKNSSDEIILEYEIINDHKLTSIIKHQNGHEYLIFNIELYGYSVMDLTTREIFHYIPEESFMQRGETFIWCDVHYNPENNMLAVEGCYWACPYSVILVDFSNPLKESVWVDANKCIHDDETYEYIHFVEWQGTDLVLKSTLSGEDKENYILTEHQYLSRREKN